MRGGGLFLRGRVAKTCSQVGVGVHQNNIRKKSILQYNNSEEYNLSKKLLK